MNKTKRYMTVVFMLILTSMLSSNISPAKASDSPAHAAVTTWSAQDGFESNMWSIWSCWQTIPLEADNFCSASSRGHTGVKAGYISAISGWSDMRIWQTLTPFKAGRTLTCFAQIYLRVIYLALPDGLTTQLEVIDADTSQYISIKQIHYSSANGWQLIKTANWTPIHKNVLVRLGLIGVNWISQSADIDDYMVQCQY